MTATLLDGILPDASYSTTQEATVATSLGKAFRVVGEVTPADVPELQPIARRLSLEPDRPLYAQLFDNGFVVLTADPLREVVVGKVVRPWRPLDGTPLVNGRRDFVRFRAPAHLKAALSLRLAAEGDSTRIVVEVRLRATDPASRRVSQLAAGRVGPLAERMTKGWLDAVARRAAALAS